MIQRIIHIILLFPLFVHLLFPTAATAQNAEYYIKGTVYDENGTPVPGVVVSTQKGKNRTITQENGKYLLGITDTSKSLVFSSVGYVDRTMKIGDLKEMDVNLTSSAHLSDDEIIQLGYSSQKRSEISGSVSSVSGEELRKSPVANLSMSFAGRLPGLITRETYSELSRTNTTLFVRGSSTNRAKGPLVIIDGIMCAYQPYQSLDYISADEIESVTVLKDASAEALYGIQGGNGVIVITTKRGQAGKLKVTVKLEESFQQMSTRPVFINSFEYARLRNEAAYNDGKGANYFFSDEQIEKYKSGKYPDSYPNTNWYHLFMKKFAQMRRAGVDLSGGNDRVRYFTNINLMHQLSQFKTDQPDYETSPNSVWVNFRSNVDLKINQYLGAYLNLSGNLKRERVPGGGYFSQSLYSGLFYMPSNVYGPVTPTVIDEATGKISGNQVITTGLVGDPVYGMLNRAGYTRHTVTNIYSQFGLNLDMSFVTPGLKASGVVAYQTNAVNSLYTTKDYERWTRTDDPETLSFTKKGSNDNTTLSYGRGSSYYYHLTYKGLMDYQQKFGRHAVSGMAYMFYQDLSTESTGSPWCLPYRRFSSGLEATYNYDGRYFLKIDAGYSGSEQFDRGHRYTLTPAVSGAWTVSKENFLADARWLSNLKLRASLGKTASDQLDQGRYAYEDNVTFGGGGSIGYLRYIIRENAFGNPNLEAEVSTKQNYGLDMGLFQMFTVSVDVFKERMENAVVGAVSTIPYFQGIPLSNYPNINDGTFENKGYEITAGFTKALNKDLSVSLGGSLSYNKNTIVSWNEAMRTEDYVYRKREEGYSYGQEWGYLVNYDNGNGFYNFQSEISNDNLSYSFGTPRVGDLRFIDLNNDHAIDERDKAPLGTGSIPRYYYAMNGSVSYKSFDLSFLFQGVGKWSSVYGGMGVYENSLDGVFGSLHRNAWTEERWNNDERITAPALSLTTSTSNQPSDFYNYNRAYLRLKNIELGYNAIKLAKALAVSKLRFVLSGQNLFTWDKMKTGDFGPEADSYESIPVYRVYNVGIKLQF